jgi:hypothetical protein
VFCFKLDQVALVQVRIVPFTDFILGHLIHPINDDPMPEKFVHLEFLEDGHFKL